MLLMDYIEGESQLDAASLRHLGELLAGCHRISAPAYGLERDTLTGPLRQPNVPSQLWIPFFREQRLLYMVGVARDSGNLPGELETRLLHFADALEKYLIEPSQPALVHGDIWRTNVLVRDGRVKGIIDPALYFAHNEVELAYMTLFDGVGAACFEAYQAHIAIDADFFKVRRHIYNLYPLLVHVALFGAKYLPFLYESLARFGY
ncbi:MAG: fructosamine kinase family protein [Chloroflexi bacterium]|nr:fructosamine kinase family protein [Chloroflexota bacterium]